MSVSRSVIPITSDFDRELFGGRGDTDDQVGYLEGVKARFGKSYTGEPDAIAAELAQDAAVQAADNTRMLGTIAEHIAPSIGWSPRSQPV